jgi:hypothetical protein
MTSQRPKRQTKKPSRFSQSPSFVPPESQLSAIPEVRRPQKRPLQAIPVEPIPEDLAVSLPSKQRSIPSYTPPLGYIEYIAGSGVSEALEELSAFLLLFSVLKTCQEAWRVPSIRISSHHVNHTINRLFNRL